jgi:hypothetical protein
MNEHFEPLLSAKRRTSNLNVTIQEVGFTFLSPNTMFFAL